MGKLFLLLLGISSSLLAADRTLVFHHLQVDFTYQDYSHKCSIFFEPVPAMTLVVELHDDVVRRAYLKKDSYTGTNESLSLSAEEYKGIDLFDWGGQTWIKHLPLSQKTIKWLLFTADSSVEPCRPPQPLSTMSPEAHTFVFPDLNVLTQAYVPSESVYFSGLLEDGEDYTVKMRLQQSQVPPGTDTFGEE
ncbi:MAG: hypothetical protein R3B54_16280 [Bdellovibrionota bacterium]